MSKKASFPRNSSASMFASSIFLRMPSQRRSRSFKVSCGKYLSSSLVAFAPSGNGCGGKGGFFAIGSLFEGEARFSDDAPVADIFLGNELLERLGLHVTWLCS